MLAWKVLQTEFKWGSSLVQISSCLSIPARQEKLDVPPKYTKHFCFSRRNPEMCDYKIKHQTEMVLYHDCTIYFWKGAAKEVLSVLAFKFMFFW